MIEYAQWTAVFVAIINLFFSFIDKKIFRFFQSRAATDSASGISVESLSPLFRWRLSRMRYSGFILDSETNTYYFNEIVHKANRKTLRIRLIFLVVLAILIVLSIIFIAR